MLRALTMGAWRAGMEPGRWALSLRPQAVYVVPQDTARAAFPKGNPCLRTHDELGRLSTDQDFAARFPARGQPARAPAQLALVTPMQFAAHLTDRRAAEALRARSDREYALGRELDGAGFAYAARGAFRARLLGAGQEALRFARLLARRREAGLVRARGRPRTASTAVVAASRTLNRRERVDEARRHAPPPLAAVVPDGRRGTCPAAWPERHARRWADERRPLTAAARQALAAQTGAGGRQLLQAAYAPEAPGWRREVPAVAVPRQVGAQQYHAPAATGAVRWRADGDRAPGAARIESPHAPDARYGTKRATSGAGYQGQLTESGAPDGPRPGTDVQPTPATTPDHRLVAPIPVARAAVRLPRAQRVDAGDVDAANLPTRQREPQVERLGPALGDSGWQAPLPGACTTDACALDREARRVTCPHGHASKRWAATHDPAGHPDLGVSSDAAACRAWPCRPQCPRAVKGPRRLTPSRRPSLWPCAPRGRGSANPPSRRAMPAAPAWQGRSPQGAAASSAGRRGSSVSRRPACRTA
jgi:transposase